MPLSKTHSRKDRSQVVIMEELFRLPSAAHRELDFGTWQKGVRMGSTDSSADALSGTLNPFVGSNNSLVGSDYSFVGSINSVEGSRASLVGSKNSFVGGAIATLGASRSGPRAQVQLSEFPSDVRASPRPLASLRRDSGGSETPDGMPTTASDEQWGHMSNEQWKATGAVRTVPTRRRSSSEQEKIDNVVIRGPGDEDGWAAEFGGPRLGLPVQRQVADQERASISDGACFPDDDGVVMPLLPRLKLGKRRDSWEEEEKKRGPVWRRFRSFGRRVMGALWWMVWLPGVSDEEGINVLGATLLITGSTISGGALALPAVTQDLGFIPSAVSMTGCWLFQVLEGLLLAEVIVGIMQRLKKDSASITSAASETLGQRAAYLLSGCYVFYMNATLVANIARGATIVSAIVELPLDMASLSLVLASGALLFVGGVRAADHANRVLTGLLLLSLGLTILTGLGHMEVGRLAHGSWSAVPSSLPVIMQVLNFLCMLPVVCSYLHGEIRLIRVAVILGSGIPLLLYIAWDAVALGLLPTASLSITERQVDPVDVLIDAQGAHMGLVLTLFAFTAVATTILGCHLGLSDFFFEYMLPSHSTPSLGAKASPICGGATPEERATPVPARRAKVWACSMLTLLPSLLLAMTVPDMVYLLLDYTSLYIVTILFGVAPPLMCWCLRSAREDRAAAFAVEKPSLQRDFTSRRSLLVVAASLSVLLLFLKAFEHYGLLLSTLIPGMQVAPKNVPIAR